MASRHERMQQRLRGVQRREVKEVDFGLFFPAARKVEQSESTQTPTSSIHREATLNPVVSSQRTPLVEPQILADTIATISTGKLSSNVVRSANANTSKKRRKLFNEETPLTSSRNSKSFQRDTSSQNSRSFKDDVNFQNVLANETNDSIEQASEESDSSKVNTSKLKPVERRGTPPVNRTVLEVTESPINAPGSGQRIQVLESSLQNSQLRSAQSENKKRSFVEQNTPLFSKRSRSGKEIDFQNSSLSQDKLPHANYSQIGSNVDDGFDELSPDRFAFQASKSKISHFDEKSSPTNSEEQEISDIVDEEKEDQSLVEDQVQSSENLRLESPDLDKPRTVPITKKRTQAKSKSDINQQTRSKSSNPRTKFKTTKRRSNTKSHSRGPIPITFERLTTPKFTQDEGNETGALNSEITHVKRRDINWIDVLMKSCREVIRSKISVLRDRSHECRDTSTRREFKTKLQALEAFGVKLQDQLLEHTLDLDNAYLLEHRLREEQKKKIHLRQEILRVRAEREQVALKMDEIRRQHKEAQEENLKQTFLNNAVHNLELAIDIGRDIQKKNSSSTQNFNKNITPSSVEIQALVKSVAHEVSNKSGIGGLLSQVKDFNSFLERTAIALEERKVS